MGRFSSAAASTRLGQLQRGRGAGWLGAAETRAIDLLEQCLEADPRYDSQVESRADYYATLAIELGFPARSLALGAITDESLRWLRLDVIAIMAKRGVPDARQVLWEHLDGGHGSEHVIQHLLSLDYDLPRLETAIAAHMRGDDLDHMIYRYAHLPWEKWATRNPKIRDANTRVTDWRKPRSALPDLEAPLEDILGIDLSPVPTDFLVRFTNRATSAELARLQQAAMGDDRPARYFALAVLGARNDPCALELAERTFAADTSGRDRATLYRYIRQLDGSQTLPLARRWLGLSDSRSGIAACLMALHSEADDVPAIRAAFAREWSENECTYSLCDLVEALGRHPEQGPFEELRLTFNDVVYSIARKRAAVAMAHVDPRFEELFARECLWDCEPQTQIVGLEAANLRLQSVASRVNVLATHSVDGNDQVQRLAAKRLASS